MADRTAVGRVLRRTAFWGLLVAFTIYYATFSALTFHLYPLLLEHGFAALAVFAAVYGAANGIMTIVRGFAVPEMLMRPAAPAPRRAWHTRDEGEVGPRLQISVGAQHPFLQPGRPVGGDRQRIGAGVDHEVGVGGGRGWRRGRVWHIFPYFR